MADINTNEQPLALDPVGQIHDQAAGSGDWSEAPAAAFKWGLASIAAAGTGLYNTGVAVGNALGGDFNKVTTYGALAEFDSDLAKYYSEHEAGTEVAGMVIGAIVPGMAGTKIMKAGQVAMRASAAGEAGTLTARLTGILAPDTAAFSALARADVAASSAKFPLLQSSVLKAIGTGFQQQTLESAAFTLASTPTMLQSPVLSDADNSSIAKDLVMGTLFGGVLGGVVHGIGVTYGASKAAAAFDISRNKLFPREVNTSLQPGSKIVSYVDDLRSVAPQVTPEDVMLGKIPGLAKEFPPVGSVADASGVQREVAEKLAARMNASRSQYLDDTLNRIKSSLTEAGADTNLNRRLTSLIQMTNGDSGFMLDVQKVARAGDGELAQTLKAKGHSTTYVQLFDDAPGGATAGAMYNNAPKIWRMADLVSEDAKLMPLVNKNKVAIAPTVDFSDFAKYSELDADARYIRASHLDDIDLSIEYNRYDIPMLKQAVELGKDINIEGNVIPASLVRNQLVRSIDAIVTKAQTTTGAPLADALSHRLDVTRNYLDGVHSSNMDVDLFASKTTDAAYHSKLQTAGLVTQGAGVLRTRELPKFAALQNAPAPAGATVLNNMVVDAAASVKARLALAAQQAERYTLMAFPEMKSEFSRLAAIDPHAATRAGAGAKALGYSNSPYLSTASAAEHNGLVTNTMKNKAAEAAAKDGTPVFKQLIGNKEASAELGAVMAQVQRAGEQYVPLRTATKENILVRRSVLDALKKDAEAQQVGVLDLFPDAASIESRAASVESKYSNVANTIRIKNKTAMDVINKHVDMCDDELTRSQHLDMARGVDSTAKTERLQRGFYVPQQDPKQFPYKAFVQDMRLGNGLSGRTTMIHAADEQQLRAMIDKIPQGGTYRVYTRAEAERFYASEGAREYAETLHDARINSDLASKGIMSPAFVITDGEKLANMLNDFHVGRARMQATDAVAARFRNEFDTLREMGQRSRDVSSAKMGKLGSDALVNASDPYTDIIKTSLDQSKFSEYTGLFGIDQFLNRTADSMVRNVRMLFTKAKSAEDVDKITTVLQAHGVQTPWMDAAGTLLADHPAGTQALTRFVRRTNGILASLTLSDSLNAVNNAVGAAFMRSNELRFIIGALEKGDAGLVGKLADLAKVNAGGVQLLNPAKMQARAYADFAQMRTGHPLYKMGKEMGWIKDSTDVMHAVIDELTPGMSDTAKILNSRTEKAMSMLRKITLNDLAEDTNRFVSAHVAKQVTDLGVKAGVISDKEALTIITTFVNRVEGTILASQKPIIFNGALGSAMGLFQSYTFRLAQQLLRNVAEGGRKEAAMLAGLQATFYGTRGLPAWDAMNQHIFGTMSTNPQSRDAYDAIYSGAGKAGGDLLLYGLPSNILHTNLYTRGDINPRHPTIVPTNFADLPVVGMVMKAGAMAKMMISEGAQTGNIGHAILTGLEHNGIHRPLAGVAQLVKGFAYNNGEVVATSNTNTPLFASSLYDWTQLSRLSGGRPLEESAAIDGLYRVQAYTKAATARRTKLAETIRLEMQAGTLTPDKVQNYVQDFVHTGERQTQFAKWTASIVKSSKKTEVDQLTTGLNTPYSYKMQLLMGGKPAW